MKINIIVKLFCLLLVGGVALTSCLEGDLMNTPPGASPTIVEMSYVTEGGTLFNSGLRYFGAQALFLSPADDSDTITFAATIQGPVSQDVTVTLQLEPNRALDNFAGDGVEYAVMAANQYKLLSTTGVIPQGKTYVEFKLVMYPPNIDFTESIILPITVTTDAGLTVSSNHGRFYPHIVGNPIAGLYTREFIRYGKPNPAPEDSPDIHNEATVVFAPVDPTTINTPTGYFDGAPYIITFDDDGAGHLTNFHVALDPAWLTANWATQDPPIEVTEGPTLEVSDDYTTFTVKYKTKTRNVTDIYTKQ